MKTLDEHLKQASNNEDFAERLLQSGDATSVMWAATLVFYAAIHYGRAFLTARGPLTIRTHPGFESTFRQSWAAPNSVLSHYRLLKVYSERARYDCIEYSVAEVLKLRDDHLHPFRDAILAALAVP
jgi:uncharacterized protein (UPF0332 family)